MIKNRNSPMNKFAMGSSAHHRPPNIRYSSSRRFQYSFVGFQGATSLRTACRRISGRRFSGREATTGNTTVVRRLVNRFFKWVYLVQYRPKNLRMFLISMFSFWLCGFHVVYPIIKGLVPSPSGFEIRQLPPIPSSLLGKDAQHILTPYQTMSHSLLPCR